MQNSLNKPKRSHAIRRLKPRACWRRAHHVPEGPHSPRPAVAYESSSSFCSCLVATLHWSIVGQDAKRQINQLQKTRPYNYRTYPCEEPLLRSGSRIRPSLCRASWRDWLYATSSTCWELDHDNLATFGLAQTALTASL